MDWRKRKKLNRKTKRDMVKIIVITNQTQPHKHVRTPKQFIENVIWLNQDDSFKDFKAPSERLDPHLVNAWREADWAMCDRDSVRTEG